MTFTPPPVDHRDIRIMELLEQNRQLKAKCARVDEYDKVVDLNTELLDACKYTVDNLQHYMTNNQIFITAMKGLEKAIALVEGDTDG